jgi:hypothetical protein
VRRVEGHGIECGVAAGPWGRRIHAQAIASRWGVDAQDLCTREVLKRRRGVCVRANERDTRTGLLQIEQGGQSHGAFR